MAPHLKALMGPWWFSQFDPASEVSQAAKRSLQVCFWLSRATIVNQFGNLQASCELGLGLDLKMVS